MTFIGWRIAESLASVLEMHLCPVAIDNASTRCWDTEFERTRQSPATSSRSRTGLAEPYWISNALLRAVP